MITIGFEAHRKDQGFLFHNNLNTTVEILPLLSISWKARRKKG